MSFLFRAAYHSDECALVAPVNDCRALILMRKQLFVGQNFLAALFCVAAFEHDLAQEVPGHSIYTIKLTLIPAKWTSIWILLEPVSFAITAEGFFTNDAFDWIF
jgi:hypothetical protein